MNVNICKLLKRGTKLVVEGKGNMLAVFKYERLTNFCYICGCLDHQELDCDEVIRRSKVGGKVKREYRPWMSIGNIDFLSKKVEGQKINGID